ncbi:MAG: SsrA-binding protein SmpB [Cyclobacteriaceae bacterium]
MAKDKKRFSNDISIKNRKASYEYSYIETFEAGLVLRGTEIKSIREGKVSLQEAYCFVADGEAFVKGMNISPYSQASFTNHEPTRQRKLLLSKREIEKLATNRDEKGLTIIPVKLYINSRGLAKMQIALAKGKKLYDKRNSIKEKDQKRELSRMRLN